MSVPVAIEWIARTGQDLELMELGLLGAKEASLESLRPAQQAAIMMAQTGLARLQALIALSRTEDSALEMSIRHEPDGVRVICNMVGLDRHPFVCLAEWLNLQAVISVVRSVAGASWSPRELCFVSENRPPEAVLTAFPNTRILMGQPHTGVVIEPAFLARTTNHAITSAGDLLSSTASVDEKEDHAPVWSFATLLRMMVQPYLNEGRPDVAFAAELAGVSTRTLQRMLRRCGSSYSQILQQARFELACTRLEDPDLKVIDVAMMAGYGSPQHFTRAFRRIGGVTPSEYRRYSSGNDARA